MTEGCVDDFASCWARFRSAWNIERSSKVYMFIRRKVMGLNDREKWMRED